MLISSKTLPLTQSKIFPWLIIAAGIVLRLRQYLFNRALWVDEAMLVHNMVQRPMKKLLFELLDLNQAAPPAFLFVEKSLMILWGSSEYVLRLFPFTAGAAALVLFYPLAGQILSRRGQLIALALFSISTSLIYYSAEVKQYSGDVFWTVVIYLNVIPLLSQPWKASKLFLLAVTGATAVWFSHASLFVLAGTGSFLIVTAIRNRNFPQLRKIVLVSFFWALSFAACYFLSLRAVSANGDLTEYWTPYFIPFPPKSLIDFRRYFEVLAEIFYSFGKSQFPALIVAILGCRALQRQKQSVLFLTAPFIFAALASVLQKYPFAGKFLLFAMPAVFIVMAAGIDELLGWMKTKRLVPALLLFSCLASPVYSASLAFIKPTVREEVKPLMEYMSSRILPGDVVYVYNGAHPAFNYYAGKYGLKNAEIVFGITARENPRAYKEDLNKLSGRGRIWVLFSHICTWRGVDEEKFITGHLDTLGKRMDLVKAPGASLYLYELREKKGSAA